MKMETRLIYKKMNEVMKDIGAVTKNQKNTAQGFKFRGIDQFVNALYPALCKHGVFMAPAVVTESHELKDVQRSNGKAGVDKHVHLSVEYTFYAEDGSSVKVGPIAAEGLDSGDKATNKALSAALKYALIQTFSIPTEDMAEADLDSPEIGTSVTVDSPVVDIKSAKVEGVQKAIEATQTLGTTTINGAAKKTTSSFRKPKTEANGHATPAASNNGGWE